MSQRPFLLPDDPAAPFPPAELALRQPDGLLAIGGDLSIPRLLNAYRHGIFPWYSDGQPILWWSPDPRMVFHTSALHANAHRSDGVRLSSRFRRTLRRSEWTVRADHDFETVIRTCARIPRDGQHGTWITEPMVTAYIALHLHGHAHSIEVMDGSRLVGGLYGVAIGRMFFGESMFSVESGGSKVALAALAHRLAGWGWPLIDAQVENRHLLGLGAVRMPRSGFLAAIGTQTTLDSPAGHWRERFGNIPAPALADAHPIAVRSPGRLSPD